MQQRSMSRRLAFLTMLALAAVSFSALAVWMVPPVALMPSNAPEPTPVLLLGLILIGLGLVLRRSDRRFSAAPRSAAPSLLSTAAPISYGAD